MNQDHQATAVQRGFPKPKLPALGGAIVATALVLIMPTPEGLSPEGHRLMALFVGALILWATEAIPISATALLVIAIQPLFGLIDLGGAMQNAMTPVFFFVLVMFLIALAFTKTGLAHRFALWMLAKAGTDAKRAVYVFCFGAAAISMIVSDVPAAAIFLAIALPIFAKLGITAEKGSNFGKAIMLGIPIAALIGGVGTPAGSSINLLGLEIIVQQGGERIAFVEWMAIGIPMVIVLVPLTAWVLVRMFPPEFETIGALADLEEERRRMGQVSRDEWKLIGIMSVMFVLWVLTSWPELYPAALAPLSNIFLVSMLGGIAMFLPGINLIGWKEAQDNVGWDVLLLLFAVVSLGGLSSSTGLAPWLVEATLGGVATWHFVVILLAISLFTVVIHLMLPINPVINVVMIPPIMALGTAAGFSPELFALPVIFTASCAFLLPLDAVPLVTYGKGYYKMFDMLKPGIPISAAWVVLMTALMVLIGPLIGLL
ncbi:MAG TPA: DASS family sodium-coupled anion symporter [Gammaproteobacteria bacterium]|nr:DASS family sodium-coupled anion symporter [Gammaproteobacteria bacterium]